jgi:hypothetical protein
MGLKDLVNKVQKSAKDFQVAQKEQMVANALRKKEEQQAIVLRKQEEKEAAELHIQQILEGKIEPITVSINLRKGEKAYLSVPTNRMAYVDRIVETTTGTSKKKGVIKRGVVGGVLLGPVGAITGAVTAKSHYSSHTEQQVVTTFESIDNGMLVLTDQRVIFVGNQILSLPYDQIIAYVFSGNKQIGYRFTPKYDGVQPNETFVIGGPSPAEIEVYYKGITANLVK